MSQVETVGPPTITEAVKAFIQQCPHLSADAVSVNELSALGSISIDPLPGAKTVSTDLAGNKVKEFPFTLSSLECTANELERLANSLLYEQIAQWMEDCTDNDDLPDLGPGLIAESLEATTWAYLFRREGADIGVYQINCKLVYEQKARNPYA